MVGRYPWQTPHTGPVRHASGVCSLGLPSWVGSPLIGGDLGMQSGEFWGKKGTSSEVSARSQGFQQGPLPLPPIFIPPISPAHMPFPCSFVCKNSRALSPVVLVTWTAQHCQSVQMVTVKTAELAAHASQSHLGKGMQVAVERVISRQAEGLIEKTGWRCRDRKGGVSRESWCDGQAERGDPQHYLSSSQKTYTWP